MAVDFPVFEGEAEFETIEVMFVGWVGEVRRSAGRGGREAAVVLDADCEGGGDFGRGYSCLMGGVDWDFGLVMVGGAGGYVEDVFVCHWEDTKRDMCRYSGRRNDLYEGKFCL